MTSRLRGVAGAGASIVVLAAVCLSTQNNLAPVVFDAGTNPATLLLLRFLTITAVMALWCLAGRQSLRLARENWLAGYLAGAGFAVASILVLTSFARIPVSLTVLIVYCQPLLTFLSECVLDRRPPRPAVLLCLLGALCGLALALRVDLDTLDPVGIAAAIAAAVAMSCAILVNGRMLKGVRSPAVNLHMGLMGVLVAVAITFIPGQFTLEQDTSFDWMVLVAALALFAIGFLSLFVGVRRVGASGATQIMNLEPVLTVLLAVAFFGESMTPVQAAGAALVIGCVAATQWIRVRSY